MAMISKEQYKIAELNGIGKKTLQNRVYINGWDVEEAIVRPVQEQRGYWNKYKGTCVVAMSTFYERIKKGMTPEEAATTPINPYNRVRKGSRATPEDMAIAEQNGICKYTFKARVYGLGWTVAEARTRPVDKRRSSKK